MDPAPPMKSPDSTTRATEILAHLVSFNSTSRNSNLDLIGWVEAYLAEHGVASTRVPDESGTKANLWATIGPADRPGYILSGHTDVVPVDDQAWSSDPFRLIERDGRLYGRGTTDMKGFLAVVLSKVPDMRAGSLDMPIYLAFSHDEEVGCIGVRDLIAKLDLLQPVKPIACFVGEPTSMQVITAHKAKYSYRVTVRGKSAHSSLAPHGVNAIDIAAELIVKIRSIARRMETEGPWDALYDVGFSTAHTGTIAGGTVLNIVPEKCIFQFEFRMLPGVDHVPYEREIIDLARTLKATMQAKDPATGIDIALTNGFPGFDTQADSDVSRLAMRFAGRNDHGKVAYGTEAGLFASLGGIPSVVVGPGSIEQAHKPDEFIEVSELAKCGVFLDRLITDCQRA